MISVIPISLDMIIKKSLRSCIKRIKEVVNFTNTNQYALIHYYFEKLNFKKICYLRPKLCLIKPTIDLEKSELRLEAPGMKTLTLLLCYIPDVSVEISVCGNKYLLLEK